MSFATFGLNAVLSGLVIFQGLLIIALLRQLHEIHQLLQEIEVTPGVPQLVGARISPFNLRSARYHTPISSDNISAGGVLVFLSHGCSSCRNFIGSLSPNDTIPRNVLFLWTGDASEAAARVPKQIDYAVLTAQETAQLFSVVRFPTAIAIRPDGTIATYAKPETYKDVETLLRITTTAPPLATLHAPLQAEHTRQTA